MRFTASLQKIVNWLTPIDEPQKSDLIFVFGEDSYEVPIKAAALYNAGYAPHIILTGNTGTFANKNWQDPIAKVFEKKLLELGIPSNAISVQASSLNTLEDVLLSKDLIAKYIGLTHRIIIVAKPVHQLRALATIKKQLPQYDYINQPSEFDPQIDTLEHIAERCQQEIERLKIYANKGDILDVSLP